MVTIIGSVGSRIYSESLAESGMRHFELQTTVYDTSKAAPLQFSVICIFDSGKRWGKTKIPSSGSFVSVTAKVVGHTRDTKCLALRVLDLAYLPRPSLTAATQDSTFTPTVKRSAANRWGRRVDSSTPSKKVRNQEPDGGPATNSGNLITVTDTAPYTPPAVENNKIYRFLPRLMPPLPQPLLTPTCPPSARFLHNCPIPVVNPSETIDRNEIAVRQKNWLKARAELDRTLLDLRS
jgi:hypothetical protein